VVLWTTVVALALASSAFCSPVTSEILWVCDVGALPSRVVCRLVTSDIAWEWISAALLPSAVAVAVLIGLSASEVLSTDPSPTLVLVTAVNTLSPRRNWLLVPPAILGSLPASAVDTAVLIGLLASLVLLTFSRPRKVLVAKLSSASMAPVLVVVRPSSTPLAVVSPEPVIPPLDTWNPVRSAVR